MATHYSVNRARYPITKYPYWRALQSAREFVAYSRLAKKRTDEQIRVDVVMRRAVYKKSVNEHRKNPRKPKRAKMQACPACGDPHSLTVERRRLNTAYHNEESNWQTSCCHCFRESVEHYQELWDDYNSSRL